MKQFLGNDFLLDSSLAQELYSYARKMPIFDFHCHLVPQEIAEDRKFKTITEVWLGADHYKWRLLREYGVDEEYITGNASDYDKFLAYAKAMPYFIGNPIYEWTHLELRRYFGINDLLNEENARSIYDRCNEKLKDLSARKMMEMMNVSIVFTTDDPVDDLHYHEQIAADTSFKIRVSPCWRPDKLMKIGNVEVFSSYVKTLSAVCKKEINNIEDLFDCISQRIDFFAQHGCVASDHDFNFTEYVPTSIEAANDVFQRAMRKETLTFQEEVVYRSCLMLFLGREYSRHNWVQQYHIGAIRNNSTRMFHRLGADAGFDSTNDQCIVTGISKLMNDLDKSEELPKTILYCLNEQDYGALSPLVNSFQDGKTRGKIQLGAAWWFNDNFEGMENQMKRLSSTLLISLFVGMLTDSRSFLSYPRHEYFRREMCNYIAQLVEKGRYPYDVKTLRQIVEDISYNNAIQYFIGK